VEGVGLKVSVVKSKGNIRLPRDRTSTLTRGTGWLGFRVYGKRLEVGRQVGVC
jgi:hypothetical protein